MGATAKGYPYPDPGDPVANTDLAIKALAQFLEANGFKAMAAGVANANFAASAVGTTGAVAFPVGRFTAPPVVAIGLLTGTSLYFHVMSAVSAASFTCAVRRSDGTSITGAVSVHWVAVQMA